MTTDNEVRYLFSNVLIRFRLLYCSCSSGSFSSQFFFRFFTVDVEAIFEGTPLQPTLTHIAKSSDPTTILSDALRVLLVWKYGGFYSDLDVVVLKSLKEFRNVIGAARGTNPYYALFLPANQIL